jgi:hypothetical protein
MVGRTLHKQELKYFLGKHTVKRIEKHAKRMGIRGQTRGRWFRVDRNTSMLEVTVDRIPVAELYDYRNDGHIDELFLKGPPRYAHLGDARYRWFGDWDGDWDDWDDDWDDWDDDRRRYRRPR